MESDLSSSDGALRRLFVEDVELLDRCILMSSGLSLWEESRRSRCTLGSLRWLSGAHRAFPLPWFAHFMGSFVWGVLTSRTLISLLSISAHQTHPTLAQPALKIYILFMCFCGCVCVSVCVKMTFYAHVKSEVKAGHTCHVQGLIRGLTLGLTQRSEQEKVNWAKWSHFISLLKSRKRFITGVIAKEE